MMALRFSVCSAGKAVGDGVDRCVIGLDPSLSPCSFLGNLDDAVPALTFSTSVLQK